MSICDRTGNQLHISRVNTISFQGLGFCFEWSSTFFMQTVMFMLSLLIKSCNDCLEKTCEPRQETLFVCVLCETGWQQTMSSQGNCKHSMERGSRTFRTNIKRGVHRQRRIGLLFSLHLVQIVYNEELVKIGSCYLISAIRVTTSRQALCSY